MPIMDSGTPVPLPRSRSPLPQTSTSGKKPVPLPRKTLLESNTMLPTDANKKAIETKIKSNGYKEDALTKGYNTLTKSLKNEFKSASDSVQEKSKAVIESTKIVSARLEKSVRGILTRRPSTTCSAASSPKENSLKLERCQSLPVAEIFHSISFDSPLTVQEDSNIRECQNSDSDVEESMPPPSFPPPPLPDESLYDEVQSVRSSQSAGRNYENYCLPPTSSNHSECSSYYEELPAFSTLDVLRYSSSDSDKSQGSETLKSISETNKKSSRSDSWSFYDSVHIIERPKSEPYENVVLRDDIKYNSVNNIYTQCPSTAATANSEPGTLTNRSSDVEGSFTCGSDQTDSCASRPPSTISSLSVTNELYDNWDPIARLKENQENQKQRRLLPSKSVIIEFDPLYENVVHSALEESENAPKEFNEETDSFLHSPRYSMIESGEESEEDLGLSPPPAVPERVDSISTAGSVKNIPNDVEYYLYHRTKDKCSGNVEITPKFNAPESVNSTFYDTVPIEEVEENEGGEDAPNLVTTSQSPDREGSPGKRRPSQLVRWTSMKRAIKAVADSSNWSPGVIRRMSKSVAASKTSLTDDEPAKPDLLQRPLPDLSSSRIHSSFVFRSPSGGEKAKDFAQRWCHLGEGKLSFSSEKHTGNNKDYISLDSISSISAVRDVKLRSGNNTLENEYVRKECAVKLSLRQCYKRNTLKWFGHVESMKNRRLT